MEGFHLKADDFAGVLLAFQRMPLQFLCFKSQKLHVKWNLAEFQSNQIQRLLNGAHRRHAYIDRRHKMEKRLRDEMIQEMFSETGNKGKMIWRKLLK